MNPDTGSAASQSPNRHSKSCPGDLLNSQPSTKPAASESFAAMKSAALSGPVHRLRAGHDGRQYRARDQLLGGVPEIPFARAGRALRCCRTGCRSCCFPSRVGGAGRPLRPAPHHPVRHAAVHRRVGRMGHFLRHRHARRCGMRCCCWSSMAAPACCGRRRTSCCSTTSSGPADLPSAVRLNAMARYLGVLVGPAVGGVIMLALGPSHGIILNTLFYLPMLLWLFWAPVARQGRGGPTPRRPRPCRHRADHPRHRPSAC